MKRIAFCFLSSLMMIAVLISVVGCNPRPQSQSDDFDWVVVQSPVTGRYYEMAMRSAGYKGYLGMSEVSAEEYVFFKNHLEKLSDAKLTVSDFDWSVIKSPVTDRYYEVARRAAGYKGYLGMSEVSKEDYLKYLESVNK